MPAGAFGQCFGPGVGHLFDLADLGDERLRLRATDRPCPSMRTAGGQVSCGFLRWSAEIPGGVRSPQSRAGCCMGLPCARWFTVNVTLTVGLATTGQCESRLVGSVAVRYHCTVSY